MSLIANACGHASGDLSTVQPGYFGRLCGRLRGTRHGAAAEDQGHNAKAHVLVNACQLTRLDDDAGLLENFPPHRVARVLVQLDDPAGHTPGHLLLRTRNGVHRRGVARSRGQDPRVHHRDPDQSRPRRRPRPRRRSRPGRPAASPEKEAQPGPARGRARRGRGQGHRLDTRASRPVSALEDPSVVCDILDALAVNLDGKPAAPEYFSRRRRVLHRALGYAVRKKRLSQPAEQRQPARRLDPAAGPRRHPRPARCRQPGPGRVHARCLRHRRQTAGPAVPRLLRLHVLRHDAPVRGRRPHPRGLPPARDRMGPPDLRRLQPRRREGLHRRRPGPRAPRPQRPHQGQAHRPRARRPVRKVPIPPELVELLRAHIQPSASPPTGGCSGPRTVTRSSPPPGGRSGRRSAPRRSPPPSSPRR